MSKRSLHRLFKSDVKMTFIYYYTLLRMFKALEYVLEKKHTIGEIALMVGYSSLPAFSTTFLNSIILSLTFNQLLLPNNSKDSIKLRISKVTSSTLFPPEICRISRSAVIGSFFPLPISLSTPFTLSQ